MYLDHYCLPNNCNTSLQNIIISQLPQEKKKWKYSFESVYFLKTKFLSSILITTNRLILKFQIKAGKEVQKWFARLGRTSTAAFQKWHCGAPLS